MTGCIYICGYKKNSWRCHAAAEHTRQDSHISALGAPQDSPELLCRMLLTRGPTDTSAHRASGASSASRSLITTPQTIYDEKLSGSRGLSTSRCQHRAGGEAAPQTFAQLACPPDGERWAGLPVLCDLGAAWGTHTPSAAIRDGTRSLAGLCWIADPCRVTDAPGRDEQVLCGAWRRAAQELPQCSITHSALRRKSALGLYMPSYETICNSERLLLHHRSNLSHCLRMGFVSSEAALIKSECFSMRAKLIYFYVILAIANKNCVDFFSKSQHSKEQEQYCKINAASLSSSTAFHQSHFKALPDLRTGKPEHDCKWWQQPLPMGPMMGSASGHLQTSAGFRGGKHRSTQKLLRGSLLLLKAPGANPAAAAP